MEKKLGFRESFTRNHNALIMDSVLRAQMPLFNFLIVHSSSLLSNVVPDTTSQITANLLPRSAEACHTHFVC
jgi:hypothetical protein